MKENKKIGVKLIENGKYNHINMVFENIMDKKRKQDESWKLSNN